MILTPLEAVVSIAMNAISRKFEYEADQFACELESKLKAEDMNDMGDRLGRALITLHVKNLSTVWVDWLCVLMSTQVVATHLDIYVISRYSAYHHSHPTLTERLKALEGYKSAAAKKES